MNQVSVIITKAVEAKGGVKSKIARRLKISSQLLGQYMAGRHKPKPEFYIKWKEAFNEDLLSKIETNVSDVSDNDRSKVGDLSGQLYSQTLYNLSESNKALAEANRQLSEAHKLIAKNNDELFQLAKGSTAHASPQTHLDVAATFAQVLVKLAEVGTGKRWKSQEEAIAELNTIVPDFLDRTEGNDTRTHSSKKGTVKQ